MRETWYVLDDDTVANPNECAPDDAGVLRHKSGAAVQMRSPDCPMSRGVDVDEAKAVEQKPVAPPLAPADAQMKPAATPKPKAKPGYKTRAAK